MIRMVHTITCTRHDNASPVREKWTSMLQGVEKASKRRMGPIVDQINDARQCLYPEPVWKLTCEVKQNWRNYASR